MHSSGGTELRTQYITRAHAHVYAHEHTQKRSHTGAHTHVPMNMQDFCFIPTKPLLCT